MFDKIIAKRKSLFDKIIDKRKSFNGKPFSHWEEGATELVVEMLLRASLNVDEKSLIGYLASKRLGELARDENPELYERVLAKKEASHQLFLKFFGIKK